MLLSYLCFKTCKYTKVIIMLIYKILYYLRLSLKPALRLIHLLIFATNTMSITLAFILSVNNYVYCCSSQNKEK